MKHSDAREKTTHPSCWAHKRRLSHSLESNLAACIIYSAFRPEPGLHLFVVATWPWCAHTVGTLVWMCPWSNCDKILSLTKHHQHVGCYIGKTKKVEEVLTVIICYWQCFELCHCTMLQHRYCEPNKDKVSSLQCQTEDKRENVWSYRLLKRLDLQMSCGHLLFFPFKVANFVKRQQDCSRVWDVLLVIPAASDCGWPGRRRAGCRWHRWQWWWWEPPRTEEGRLHLPPAPSKSNEGSGEEIEMKFRV